MLISISKLSKFSIRRKTCEKKPLVPMLKANVSNDKIENIFNDYLKEADVGRDNKQKLELAKRMAEKISARKGDNQSDSQKTAHAVLNGLQAPEPVQQPTITGQAIADQIAAKLNRKLGYVPLDKAETDTQLRSKILLPKTTKKT